MLRSQIQKDIKEGHAKISESIEKALELGRLQKADRDNERLSKFDEEYSTTVAPLVLKLHKQFSAMEPKDFFLWYKNMMASEESTEWTRIRKAVSTFWRKFKRELCVPEVGSSIAVSLAQLLSKSERVWVHRAKDFMKFAVWEIANYYALNLDLENASDGSPEWWGNNGPHKHVSRALMDNALAGKSGKPPRTEADEDALRTLIEDVVKPAMRGSTRAAGSSKGLRSIPGLH